ncbi:hypothetical protein TNCV_1955911 [Trichonephila clavipes]|nr:hypothetical protein TNCV_1955911 [Trichonephila clavipes]
MDPILQIGQTSTRPISAMDFRTFRQTLILSTRNRTLINEDEPHFIVKRARVTRAPRRSKQESSSQTMPSSDNDKEQRLTFTVTVTTDHELGASRPMTVLRSFISSPPAPHRSPRK